MSTRYVYVYVENQQLKATCGDIDYDKSSQLAGNLTFTILQDASVEDFYGENTTTTFVNTPFANQIQGTGPLALFHMAGIIITPKAYYASSSIDQEFSVECTPGSQTLTITDNNTKDGHTYNFTLYLAVTPKGNGAAINLTTDPRIYNGRGVGS